MCIVEALIQSCLKYITFYFLDCDFCNFLILLTKKKKNLNHVVPSLIFANNPIKYYTESCVCLFVIRNITVLCTLTCAEKPFFGDSFCANGCADVIICLGSTFCIKLQQLRSRSLYDRPIPCLSIAQPPCMAVL